MEKKREFIIGLVYVAFIVGILYISLRYVLPTFMPFLLGFFAASLVNPFIRTLSKKFDMKPKPLGILMLLIFYATIGMLTTVMVVRMIFAAGEFSKELPQLYAKTIEPAVGIVFDYINRALEGIDRIFGQSGSISSEKIEAFLTSIKSSIGNAVSELSVKALTKLSGFAAAIPRVAVQLIFAIISSFFFTVDYETIVTFLKNKLPEKFVKKLSNIRKSSFKTIGRYIRSYAIIMLITFSELSLGLLLLRIEHPFASAFFISLFDILPVVGTGTVIVPWALIKLLCKDIRIGFGMLALWVMISVVRNIIEPKIVGKQVGLHPLATLISMYIGTKLFGVIGLFLLPVGLSVWSSCKKDISEE